MLEEIAISNNISLTRESTRETWCFSFWYLSLQFVNHTYRTMLTLSGGILAHIRNCNKAIYDPMKFTWKQVLDTAARLYEPSLPHRPQIHLGLVSWKLLDFAESMKDIKVKHWVYIPKRNPKFIYVSLFRKHGLFKMKVFLNPSKNQSKYELLYGTEPMIRSSNLKFLKVLNDIP